MNKKNFALIHSLASLIVSHDGCHQACVSGSIYVHVGHASVQFLIQEVHTGRSCVIAKVRSSSVSVVYVVRLRILIFSKAAF